jgi:aspartate aminotransferase
VAGSGFGCPGHMRLSFACSMDTLKKTIERLRAILPTQAQIPVQAKTA